jgi:hypothetical protein
MKTQVTNPTFYHNRLAQLLLADVQSVLVGNGEPTGNPNEVKRLKIAISEADKARISQQRAQYGFAAIDLVS